MIQRCVRGLVVEVVAVECCGSWIGVKIVDGSKIKQGDGCYI